MTRRQNDFYPTPEWATKELTRRISIRGTVFECCAGDGAIARPLATDRSFVYTGDIDPAWSPLVCGDALERGFWNDAENIIEDGIDWIVTNPPFSVAPQIIPIAYSHASKGIAMLLRLSYLEPVENRGEWLNRHPPNMLIVLPRISFTGDGKTDNVTCAWMVWKKDAKWQQIIIAENPRFVPANEGIRPVAEEGLFAALA